MALAEGIILDNKDVQQGERDFLVFELWVNGFSPQEIAEKEEVTWLKNRNSVDDALRRIIHKLWEFFDVSCEDHAMVVGNFTRDKSRISTGFSARENSQRWYANPENRERHQQRCREQIRERRAAKAQES